MIRLAIRDAAGAALLAAMALSSGQAAAQMLSILNYDDYLDSRLVGAFERQHDVKVELTYFESNLDRDQVMRTASPEQFDLVLFGGEEATVRRSAGLLGDLDRHKAPNLANIESRWQSAYAGVSKHCAAYFWGGSGIAYRADRLPEPPTSWAALLRPPETWAGHISMVSDGRELLGVSLKALGASTNSSDPAVLRAAGDLLLKQKPMVGNYDDVTLTPESELITGDIWLSFAYNGDAGVLNELDPNIRFLYPTEGVALWVDYLCLLASSTQPALAHKFLDFLNDPVNAARNAETVYYASPNRAALPLTSDAYRESTFVFPPAAVLEKSEFIQPLPARSIKIVNEIQALLLKP